MRAFHEIVILILETTAYQEEESVIWAHSRNKVPIIFSETNGEHYATISMYYSRIDEDASHVLVH